MITLTITCDKKLLEPMEQASGRWNKALPGELYFSKIGLATERFRAVDLSGRACSGRWAWIPGGGLRSAPF